MLDERVPRPVRHALGVQRHATHPFVLRVDGKTFALDYEPAESTTGMFGGNSNWRGPVWFPLNYLLIESLQKLHRYLRRRLQGRVPDRLRAAADAVGGTTELSRRLIELFLRDATAAAR